MTAYLFYCTALQPKYHAGTASTDPHGVTCSARHVEQHYLLQSEQLMAIAPQSTVPYPQTTVKATPTEMGSGTSLLHIHMDTPVSNYPCTEQIGYPIAVVD